MKFLFGIVFFAVIAITLNYGVSAQETPATEGPTINLNDLIYEQGTRQANGRFFFSLNPCTSTIASLFNVQNSKCSLSCIVFGGQNGGYCDENNECQCNQITVTDAK